MVAHSTKSSAPLHLAVAAEHGRRRSSSRVRDCGGMRMQLGNGVGKGDASEWSWATLSFQGGHLSPYANTHHSDTPANGPDTLSGVHSGMAQTGGEL